MRPPVSVTFRRITASDQDFLWEMLYQAIYTPPGEPLPPRAIIYQPELAHYVQDWPKPGDLGMLAEDSSRSTLLGAAWLRLFRSNEPGYGFVAEGIPELSIALRPESRGKGIGTALLKSLLSAARGRYAAVSLSVSADNPAAALYRRMGFVLHAQAGDSLTMVLQLS